MNNFKCSFNSCDKKCKNGFFKSKNGDSLVECDYYKSWYEKDILRKSYKHNGFDLRNYDYSPRKYVGEKSIADKNRLLNYTAQFIVSEKVRQLLVYMYGPNGCQKSTLASYVGQQLIEHHLDARYLLMKDLVRNLHNYDYDEKAKKQIDVWSNADLLIIDEAFDASKYKVTSSGYDLQFIDSFIRKRIQVDNKGLLFISNVHPDKIESQGFSYSIQDFVVRECKLHNSLLTFQDNYLSNSGIEWGNGDSLF